MHKYFLHKMSYFQENNNWIQLFFLPLTFYLEYCYNQRVIEWPMFERIKAIESKNWMIIQFQAFKNTVFLVKILQFSFLKPKCPGSVG